MSAIRIVYATIFALFVGITLIVPSYPPIQLLYKYVTIPQTTLSIWGISLATLLNGIINGCFWTIIFITAYSLTQLAFQTRKPEPLAPMPVTPHLTKPQPENPLVDPRENKISLEPTIPPARAPSSTVRGEPARAMIRKKPVPIKVSKAPNVAELAIENIEEIGQLHGALLRNSGIDTVSDLLRVGATARGRNRLAKEVGVTSATVLKWVFRGDSLRVRGIDRRYVLLESTQETAIKK